MHDSESSFFPDFVYIHREEYISSRCMFCLYYFWAKFLVCVWFGHWTKELAGKFMYDLSLKFPILIYVSLNSCQHSAPLGFKTQVKSSMDWCSYEEKSSESDEKNICYWASKHHHCKHGLKMPSSWKNVINMKNTINMKICHQHARFCKEKKVFWELLFWKPDGRLFSWLALNFLVNIEAMKVKKFVKLLALVEINGGHTVNNYTSDDYTITYVTLLWLNS